MTKFKHKQLHKMMKPLSPKQEYLTAQIVPGDNPQTLIDGSLRSDQSQADQSFDSQNGSQITNPKIEFKQSSESNNSDTQSDSSNNSDEISPYFPASIFPASNAPNYEKITIHRPEGERIFLVYIPQITQTQRSNEERPLHITFHGLNDNCQHFLTNSGFLQLSEQENHFLVAPCGSQGDFGTGWNAGVCCMGSVQVDDVAFVNEIINYMKHKYKINTSKIFASGFSNGAMLSERLACESSHLFAAVASVAGITAENPGGEDGLLRCDEIFEKNFASASVLAIHGTMDNIVPWDGNFLLGFPSVPLDIQKWAQRNKCDLEKTEQTLNRGGYSNTVWKSCNGIDVELVKAEGLGHIWPRSKEFDTATYVLEFFKRHRPLREKDEDLQGPPVTVVA